MITKKSVALFAFLALFVLVFSFTFTSANWFSDLFNPSITGEVVSNSSIDSNLIDLEDNASEFSIFARVYDSEDYNQYDTILAGPNFRFQLAIPYVNFEIKDSNNVVRGGLSSSSYPVNTETIVGIVKKGTSIKYYKDSQLIGQKTVPFPYIKGINKSDLVIGRDGVSNIGGEDFFSGEIYNVDMFDYALTQGEIMQLYNDSEETNETITCVDSDGGIDIYESGTTTGEFVLAGAGTSFTDGCYSPYNDPTIFTQVSEFYCNSDNLVDFEILDCPGTCEFGACVEESQSKNITNLGISEVKTGDFIVFDDVLVDIRILEYDQCLDNPCTTTYKKSVVRLYYIGRGTSYHELTLNDSKIRLIARDSPIVSPIYSDIYASAVNFSIIRDGNENNVESNNNSAYIILEKEQEPNQTVTCTDGDGGLNAFVFGSTNVSFYPPIEMDGQTIFDFIHSDACVVVTAYDPDGKPTSWMGDGYEFSCEGDDCYVEEAYCYMPNDEGLYDADADELIKCPNGCSNGACLPEEENQCPEIGYRFNENGEYYYCGLNLNPLLQKNVAGTCDNNYECKSNFCSDGQCIASPAQTASLIVKIWCKLSNLFGSDEEYLSCIAEF